MLNIISFKSPIENLSCPLQDTVSPRKPEEISKHVAEFQTAHYRRAVTLTHLKTKHFELHYPQENLICHK